MGSVVGFIKRKYKATHPPAPSKRPEALRFGVLGAARITHLALITAACSHDDVVIHAIAARDLDRAQKSAKDHGIAKANGGPTGYQQLLDDPEIDAVYNPLPNGLHYEWTLKALASGKHVLLEKPSTDTADETRKLFDFANSKGLVLLEAVHSRSHPVMHRVKEIIDSGEIGAIKSLTASLLVPSLSRIVLRDDDIRHKYELGGGTLMDMGCYPLTTVRFLSSSNPTDIISASSSPFLPKPITSLDVTKIDSGTTATLSFPKDITATISCHSRQPGWGPLGLLPRSVTVRVDAECEGGRVTLRNFVLPHVWHEIRVAVRDGKGGVRKRVEKAYTRAGWTGEEWWSTYRYQLEAFVDKIRGRAPQAWIDGEDSVANIEWIERIYEATGLGSRPRSSYNLPQ